MKIIYHIFTHEIDEYTTSYSEALSIYKDFIKIYNSARLYQERWNDIENDNYPIEEDCIKNHGTYPW